MITNKNIRKYLWMVLLALALVVLADLAFLFILDHIGDLFNGYSILVIPALIGIAYAYAGLPIFTFNAESDVLHIKSHMVMNRLLGKDLYMLRKNVVALELDRSGIRKKLVIHYIKAGKECTEKFSVSLLSKKKIERLAQTVQDIDSEARNLPNTPMFI
tara:strand:+ start:235 stop:711 length:477 start_codon:yes stop_codon:yes gene_type:complete